VRIVPPVGFWSRWLHSPRRLCVIHLNFLYVMCSKHGSYKWRNSPVFTEARPAHVGQLTHVQV